MLITVCLTVVSEAVHQVKLVEGECCFDVLHLYRAAIQSENLYGPGLILTFLRHASIVFETFVARKSGLLRPCDTLGY